MLVVDKPKYKMAIYEAKQELHIQITGIIKPDILEEYLKDLQETVAKVPKSTYTFVMDGTYQPPLPSKVSEGLGEVIMFYLSLGFKDMIIVNPKSKISRVQSRNALETINFTGKVVDHVSETTLR